MNLSRRFKSLPPADPSAMVKSADAFFSAPAPPKKKRGPKPSGKAKALLTLRLDPDIIEAFRATGPGWQARINDTLRKHKP